MRLLDNGSSLSYAFVLFMATMSEVRLVIALEPVTGNPGSAEDTFSLHLQPKAYLDGRGLRVLIMRHLHLRGNSSASFAWALDGAGIL